MKKIFFIVALLTISIQCISQNIKSEINECAREYLDLQLFQGAIEEYARIIEIFPNDSTAHFDRGYIKSYIHDYDGALIDFTKAIAIDSTNVDNYYSRAMVFSEMKKFTEAIADFNIALGYEWDNADLHYFRALAFLNSNEYKNAIQDFKLAIEMKTDNSAIAFGYMAWAKTKLNNFNEALIDCNSAIAIDSSIAEIYFIKGYVHSKIKNELAALMDYDKGLSRLQPLTNIYELEKYRSPSLLANNGLVNKYIKKHYTGVNSNENLIASAKLKWFFANYQSAIDDLINVIRFNSENETLFYFKAIAEAQINKFPEAISDITKAIEINPNQSVFYFLRSNFSRAIKDDLTCKKDIIHYNKLQHIYDENTNK